MRAGDRVQIVRAEQLPRLSGLDLVVIFRSMRASALPQRTVERVHTVTDGFGSRVDEHIPVAEAPAD